MWEEPMGIKWLEGKNGRREIQTQIRYRTQKQDSTNINTITNNSTTIEQTNYLA